MRLMGSQTGTVFRSPIHSYYLDILVIMLLKYISCKSAERYRLWNFHSGVKSCGAGVWHIFISIQSPINQNAEDLIITSLKII